MPAGSLRPSPALQEHYTPAADAQKEETPVAGRRAGDAISGGVDGSIGEERAEVKSMPKEDRTAEGSPASKRVIAYIDGFNLYFGLRSKGMRPYLWVDPVALVESLLHPDQQLIGVKYFTSRISGGNPAMEKSERSRREAKRVRQATYLDALMTVPRLEIHYGHFLEKPERCRSCTAQWLRSEEKKTDVLIASHMLTDAFERTCDQSLLISGDSDLAPPIGIIRDRFRDHRVVVAFPPDRYAAELKRFAHAHFEIGAAKVRKAQLPDSVRTASGHELRRPTEWT